MWEKKEVISQIKLWQSRLDEGWAKFLVILSNHRSYLHILTVISSILLIISTLCLPNLLSQPGILKLLLIVIVGIGLTTIEFDSRNQAQVLHEKSKIAPMEPNQNIPELDGIRGYACLSVFLAHCFMGIIRPDLPVLYSIAKYTTALLLGGVDLFFVLSGFLIGGILIDTRGSSHYFKRFWIRRIARIFPVLYALLATYAIALLVNAHFDFPVLNKWLLADPRPPFWTYATFLQSFHIAAGGVGGPRWVGITWSLAIEEQFYFVFPIAVYFLSKRSLYITVLTSLVVAPILRHVFESIYGNWYAPYVLLPSRIDGLMFGVLVAIIVRNKLALEQVFKFRRLLDALAIGIVYLISTTHPILRQIWAPPCSGDFPPLKQSCISILCAILILRVFVYRKESANLIWRWKWLVFAGSISYPLYMYHQAINGLIHGYLFQSEPLITSYTHLLASIPVMALSILLATISYKYMEKPIRRYGHQLSNRLSNKQNALIFPNASVDNT